MCDIECIVMGFSECQRSCIIRFRIRSDFDFSFAMQNADANIIRAEIMNASERTSGMQS